MGIHAHDEIETDQAQNQGKCQDIKSSPDGHAAFYAFGITIVLFPCVVDMFTNPPRGLIRIKFQLQRIKQIGKSQQVKNQKAAEIAPEQKGYIQPDFFTVKIFMQPGKNIGST